MINMIKLAMATIMMIHLRIKYCSFLFNRVPEVYDFFPGELILNENF